MVYDAKVQLMIMCTSVPGGAPEFDEAAFAKYTPFEILVVVVLSQRTTERNCRKASDALLAKCNTPQALLDMPLDELISTIRVAGMADVKGPRLKAIAKILMEDYGGRVPSLPAQLMDLPGVGPKTVAAVQWLAFGQPDICVDTHVLRIANRLGWVRTKDALTAHDQLLGLFEKKDWGVINPILVPFGREFCLAPHPRCGACPLSEYCAKVGVHETIS